jgi:hypothetical protein
LLPSHSPALRSPPSPTLRLPLPLNRVHLNAHLLLPPPSTPVRHNPNQPMSMPASSLPSPPPLVPRSLAPLPMPSFPPLLQNLKSRSPVELPGPSTRVPHRLNAARTGATHSQRTNTKAIQLKKASAGWKLT